MDNKVVRELIRGFTLLFGMLSFTKFAFYLFDNRIIMYISDIILFICTGTILYINKKVRDNYEGER